MAPIKPKPALLTKMSRPPNVSALATAASASPVRATSSGGAFWAVPDEVRHGGDVARGGDEFIAAGKNGLCEYAAEAGGAAGDKPSLHH
ncbi:hypothetical protein [Bradyrhizobium sp. dw_78]|uniref:hypothetical protein n=1 Tax=Bradyrhizobium sp. dw_78 TaxID=2719793 RepID=UPI00201BF741|nr:hypothetical protein [Bradyrhizobium sp. dw_78]